MDRVAHRSLESDGGTGPGEIKTAVTQRSRQAHMPAKQEMSAPGNDPSAPPRSRKRLIIPVLLAIATCAGGWEGYHWFTEGRFIIDTDDAYVKADTSTIAAKVSGYITAVAVSDNAQVTAGDLLARIDDGDYKLAVEAAVRKIDTQTATIARLATQAEAQKSVIAQAAAQLVAAKAEASRTAAELDRVTKLVQSNYGTQQRLEQAQADSDRAKASVDQASAAVTAARANLAVIEAQKAEALSTRAELQTALDRAKRDLSFSEIRAPFDGVIGNKAVQPGQYVQPGTRLLSLVPLGSVYVEANFKETQLNALTPGQPVDVYVDAYSNRHFEGAVESFAPASGSQFSLLPPENATGNFTKVVQRLPVRIKVPAKVADEGWLRPGLSVVVDVHTRPAPETAVAQNAQDEITTRR